MKIRKGFVSNSSSSSFICDVCGNAESGMDFSVSDANMFECENGHTVCVDHMNQGLPSREDEFYEVPAVYCPICTLDFVTNEMMLTYLLNKASLKRDDVSKEIKESFKDYSEFSKFLKKK